MPGVCPSCSPNNVGLILWLAGGHSLDTGLLASPSCLLLVSLQCHYWLVTCGCNVCLWCCLWTKVGAVAFWKITVCFQRALERLRGRSKNINCSHLTLKGSNMAERKHRRLQNIYSLNMKKSFIQTQYGHNTKTHAFKGNSTSFSQCFNLHKIRTLSRLK